MRKHTIYKHAYIYIYRNYKKFNGKQILLSPSKNNLASW